MIERANEKAKKTVTVVCACIRRDGGREVLLSKRRAPGVDGLDQKWELPGGKIEFGETPDQAIIREIKEELGVVVHPLRLLPYLHTNRWEYEQASQHVILACFECEMKEEAGTLLGESQWFRISDIDFATTLPGTREFLGIACSDEPFAGIYIRFEYVDKSVDAFRHFAVATQPTLFSTYGLVRYWGRIGHASRFRIEEFTVARDLDARLLEITKQRLSHGYRVTEVRGKTRRYETLEEIIQLARKRGAIDDILVS